jgi:hypothetical protein
MLSRHLNTAARVCGANMPAAIVGRAGYDLSTHTLPTHDPTHRSTDRAVVVGTNCELGAASTINPDALAVKSPR